MQIPFLYIHFYIFQIISFYIFFKSKLTKQPTISEIIYTLIY